MLDQIVIPILTAVAGFLLANWKDILGWNRRVQKEEIEIGQQLMKAINDGRREILEAYEIIEKMETENRTLKRENIELTIERDQFKSLAEELRNKLAKVSQDFDDCAKQAKKYIAIQDEKDQDQRPRA